MMKEPAMAKSFTEMPISLRMLSPTKRKTIIMSPETQVAFPLSILPTLFFTSINTGSEPTTSMTANKIMLIVKISLTEKLKKSLMVRM